MALIIGSEKADAGMSQAIYQEMDNVLSPPLQKAVEDAQGDDAKKAAQKILNDARTLWKKLAFAVASGVINHITANMEVFGVTAKCNVTTAVTGNTGPAAPENHQHNVNLSGIANDVIFTQNNDGIGRVR